MKKLAAFSVLAAVVVSFAFAYLLPAQAQGFGASVEASFINVLNSSGVTGWTASVNSSGNLILTSRAAFGSTVATPATTTQSLTVDRLSGAIGLPGYTSGALAVLTPPASGYMVWRVGAVAPGAAGTGTAWHDGGALMVSTGTGQGAWSLF